jgi:hypothetical protein
VSEGGDVRRLADADTWPAERYRDLWREKRADGWRGADAVGAPGRPELRERFLDAGRELVPLPLLDLAVAAPSIREYGASGGPTSSWYQETIVVVAAPVEAGAPDTDPFQLQLADGTVSGQVDLVPFGWLADWLLVPLSDRGTATIGAVRAGANSVARTRLASFDVCASPTTITLDAAPVDVVLAGRDAIGWWEQIVNLGRLCVSAEIAGVLDALCAQSVAYAKQRTQFGATIGSFQAVQHLLVDIWLRAYTVDSVTESAATCEINLAAARAATAKAYAAEVALPVAEDALQVHGAIGYTRDRPLHQYLKRVLTLTARYGDASQLQESIGRAELARRGGS